MCDISCKNTDVCTCNCGLKAFNVAQLHIKHHIYPSYRVIYTVNIYIYVFIYENVRVCFLIILNLQSVALLDAAVIKTKVNILPPITVPSSDRLFLPSFQPPLFSRLSVSAAASFAASLITSQRREAID